MGKNCSNLTQVSGSCLAGEVVSTNKEACNQTHMAVQTRKLTSINFGSVCFISVIALVLHKE